ncbi:MAG: phosphatidate cytidylyltransferase [bacterium]
MHNKRLLIALILIPVLILYIMYLPPVFFLVLVMGVGLLAQYEFYALCRIGTGYRMLGMGAGLLLMVLVYRGGGISDSFLAGAIIVFSSVRLFGRRSPENSLRDVSLMLLGVVYVPLLLSYQIKLREFGPEWIIYIDCCIWAADSAAYYVGKGFGKKKLYESVSPKKTVAGAYGSVAGAVVVSAGASALLIRSLNIYQALVLGLVIGIASIIGDLVESMFKRDAGIKDSGTLLPGHGGFLDKIDGFVFVSPVVFWILTRVMVV